MSRKHPAYRNGRFDMGYFRVILEIPYGRLDAYTVNLIDGPGTLSLYYKLECRGEGYYNINEILGYGYLADVMMFLHNHGREDTSNVYSIKEARRNMGVKYQKSAERNEADSMECWLSHIYGSDLSGYVKCPESSYLINMVGGTLTRYTQYYVARL